MEYQETKISKESAVGSVELELNELKKIQGNERAARIETITVSCSELFTIICC